MWRVPVRHRAWIAAVAAICLMSGSALAQEPGAPSGGSSLPPVTVTAQALRRSVNNYISKVSGAWVTSDDHPMARWRSPICPLVAGLPHTEGQAIFDRLADSMTSLGIRLGAQGCRPNFFVIVTTEPDALLKAWAHRDTRLFGGGYGSRQFLSTPRPVRVWYNAELADADGRPASQFGIGDGSVFQGVPTFIIHGDTSPFFAFAVAPKLDSVVCVVDLMRMKGLNVNQVADYLVMAGLTQINLDAELVEAPTILRLFTASDEARPAGLSTWDTAFLKAVYQTIQSDRHQRVEIAKRMMREVSR